MPWSLISFFAIGPPRSQIFLVDQIALEHGATMEQKAAFAILRNQIGCVGIIQNDLGQIVVRSAAHPAIQIIPNLTGDNDCIRTLGGRNQMDSVNL